MIHGDRGLTSIEQRALQLVTDAVLGKRVFVLVDMDPATRFATVRVRSQTSWQETATAIWYQVAIDWETGDGDCTCPHAEKTGTMRCKHVVGCQVWLIYTGAWPDPRAAA